MTSVASPPTQPIRPRLRTARGTLIATLSAVAGAALAVLAAVVIAVRTSADGKTDILIGQHTSTRIAASALLVAGIAGVVALALTRWHGRRLLLLIPALLVALGATFLALLVLWLQSSNTLTPLLSGGCKTGYVIEEETRSFQGAGTVYRVDGILLTEVATTLADDGYQPFSDGAYAIDDDGASLRVWYRPGRGVSPTGQVSADGDPAFTLPKIESATTSCVTGGSGAI